MHRQRVQGGARVVLRQVLGHLPPQVHPHVGEEEQRLEGPGVRISMPRLPIPSRRPDAAVHVLLHEDLGAGAQPALVGAQLRRGLRAGPRLQAPLPGALPPRPLPEVPGRRPPGAVPLWPRGVHDDEVRGPAEVVLRRGLREAAPLRRALLRRAVPRGALPAVLREVVAALLLRRDRGGAALRPGGLQLRQAVRHAAGLRGA
mmetsp:Transcript_29296/g.83287  ORF Transcript_29296/g.83287 Transcript_29296/m.83287 type:complete len:202 (+) Transcript_29296:208-813(+)